MKHTLTACAQAALCLSLGLAAAVAQAQARTQTHTPAQSEPASAASEGGTLNEVQVREQSQEGETRGYAGVRRHTAATRTDTPLIETPQAVRVISQQFIEDIGATRLEDVTAYVSGVTRLNDFSGMWDNYAIRGFSQTNLTDRKSVV